VQAIRPRLIPTYKESLREVGNHGDEVVNTPECIAL
jgi:hypothetical protein